jgi:hypothetical protein
METIMSGYQLYLDGTRLGDELVQGFGYWRTPAEAKNGELTSMSIFPRFRVRKMAEDQWAFEQWVFDLYPWADGERRRVRVFTSEFDLVVDYGFCKLVGLTRPVPEGPFAGRWSDQVVLTFQTDGQPYFPRRS